MDVKRHWLTRRELNTALNATFPDSVHCHAFQFASDGGRWRACTATHGGTSIAAWTSEETYADQWTALVTAYRRARRLTKWPALLDYRGYSEN